jgi:hypothetical protein
MAHLIEITGQLLSLPPACGAAAQQLLREPPPACASEPQRQHGAPLRPSACSQQQHGTAQGAAAGAGVSCCVLTWKEAAGS